MSFITSDDLRNAMNAATFLAIYDDDNDGVVDDADEAVELCLERAHAEVLSYVPRAYASLPADSKPPLLLKSAELDFAVAFSLERHPEYVRGFSETSRAERWKRAEAKMERFANGQQWATDNMPAEAPGVVGGIVYDNGPRLLTDSLDGTVNGGGF